MRRVHHESLPPRVGDEFVISGDEAHHLIRVLRARVGETFGAFDGAGREVAASVVAVGKREATLTVVAEVVARRPARDVTLCTAIPRGQRMEWLVEKCTEAGVGRIVPIATARGVRDAVSANHLRRWRRGALEAAKQCGRATIPVVEEPSSLAAALEAAAGAALLLADPPASSSVADAAGDHDPVALFVGPEGGFDDDERAQIIGAGARSFGLGPLILRIETAALVAVHAVAECGDGPSATPT